MSENKIPISINVGAVKFSNQANYIWEDKTGNLVYIPVIPKYKNGSIYSFIPGEPSGTDWVAKDITDSEEGIYLTRFHNNTQDSSTNLSGIKWMYGVDGSTSNSLILICGVGIKYEENGQSKIKLFSDGGSYFYGNSKKFKLYIEKSGEDTNVGVVQIQFSSEGLDVSSPFEQSTT